MKKKSNNLFETFCGEFVEIVLDIEIPSRIDIEDGQTHEMRMPFVLSGFLMDIDEQFMYLSDSGEEVDQAFPVNALKHIRVVEIRDEANEMFDLAGTPKDSSGYN